MRRGSACALLLVLLASRPAPHFASGRATFPGGPGALEDLGVCDGADGECEAVPGRRPGRLRPSDLPAPKVFSEWESNETVTLPGLAKPLEVARGKIWQSAATAGKKAGAPDGTAKLYSGGGGREARFSVIKSIASEPEIRGMLEILRRVEQQFDTDPDSVDGMPTFEIYTEKPEHEWESNEKASSAMNVIGTPKRPMGSDPLRRELQERARTILTERITPFVRQNFPRACGRGKGRACTPCYSLIRRYREGERQSHGVHHDGHAIVTVVVPLSQYGVDYNGGLYVTTSRGQKRFLALNKGDAVVHQSDLYHGVKVLPVVSNEGGQHRRKENAMEADSDSYDSQDGEEEVREPGSTRKRPKRRRRRRRRRRQSRRTDGEVRQASRFLEKVNDEEHKADAKKKKKRRADQTAGEIYFQSLQAASVSIPATRVMLPGKKLKEPTQRGKHSLETPTKNGNASKLERWSWILWYRDSDTCEDHGHQWFEECAHDGVAVCQKLYATKLGTRPQGGGVKDVLMWNEKAAISGDATAAVKIARAYLGRLPSPLEKSTAKAKQMFNNAIKYAREPDAYYGLAELLISSIDKMAFHPEKGTKWGRREAKAS